MRFALALLVGQLTPLACVGAFCLLLWLDYGKGDGSISAWLYVWPVMGMALGGYKSITTTKVRGK